MSCVSQVCAPHVQVLGLVQLQQLFVPHQLPPYGQKLPWLPRQLGLLGTTLTQAAFSLPVTLPLVQLCGTCRDSAPLHFPHLHIAPQP